MSSLLRTKGVQIGQDNTATNNFTLYQPGVPDGTLRIGNGNSGSTTDALTINSSGNVGIGTSSPNTLFHVQGSNSGGNVTVATLRNNHAVGSTQTSLRFTNSTADGTSGGGELSYLRNPSDQGASFIVKTQSSVGVNTEHMRIDSVGRVGIGTSTTELDFEVQYLCGAIYITVADDAVATIPAPKNMGFLSVVSRPEHPTPNQSSLGFIAYDCGTSKQIQFAISSYTGGQGTLANSVINLYNLTNLTGTTGPDNAYSISTYTDFNIQLENRMGYTSTFALTFL